MNPLEGMMPQMPGSMGQSQGTNLLSIIINIIFGFVVGLIVFLGFKDVISYGSKLAGDLISLTGYGKQMSAFGFATTALPYVVLAPLAGMVARQLSSVRTLKSFGYFALALAIGFVIAFFHERIRFDSYSSSTITL
jgi:hypothetical protein